MSRRTEDGPPGVTPVAADTAEPRWLTDAEMAAWLPLIRVVYLLPQALDRQLREDVGVSHLYYQMLAMLSEQPDRTLTMGDLARLTMSSPSRLSHAVRALEGHGWVVRRPCEEDRRVQFATLTDEGWQVLRQVAPTHVRQVRQLVFDRLDDTQVAHLQEIATTLLDGLEPADG